MGRQIGRGRGGETVKGTVETERGGGREVGHGYDDVFAGYALCLWRLRSIVSPGLRRWGLDT